MGSNFEKPDYVLAKVPTIEDICVEYGIDKTDAKTITCMYELFKRVTDKEGQVWKDESYDEGYNEGWNDAVQKIENELDSVTWNIGQMKK